MAQRVAPFAAIAFLLAAAAAAQTADPGRATFKSGVDLVRFDARVVDESGRPITDLREDEIEVVEKGARLPVLLFRRITEPAGAYVDAAMRAVAAEVSSNEAFPRGHLYILIFDQQHITPGNEQRARMAAAQFVRTRVRPSDRVALLALPGPGPQIGFTSDTSRIMRELAAVRGVYQRTVATPLGTMNLFEAHRIVQGDEKLALDVMTRMASESSADVAGSSLNTTATARGAVSADDPGVARRLIVENARTVVNQSDSDSRQLLQRLADVIAGFRDIEGRKTVVLFSEGFFQDNLTRELETVAAAAAQSYCAFYPFDLNQRGAPLSEAYASDTTLATEIQSRIAPLATLAVETDGAMVVDASGRTDDALNVLADQAQNYYLIGFAPSDEARANRGKYRRVTIRVTRPGAHVMARTGYALAPEAAVADRRRAIDAVMNAPFVQQGLKMDYTTYVLQAEEAGLHRVVLSLTADLPVRSKPSDAADVVFVARDVRDGRVVASGTDTMPLPAARRTGSALGTAGWRVQFNVPAGSYLMRAVVREPGGLAGSADRRIDVRASDGPDVTVSDLVIGSVLGALPVRPRAFTGDGLSGVIEAYGRTAAQVQDLDVRLELHRAGDDATVSTFPGDLQAPEDEANGVRRRVRFQVPLTAVPPGDYVAKAVVRARGETVAERTRQVEVIAGRVQVEPSAPVIAPVVPAAEIVRGELGRRYLALLAQRARGAVAIEAARRANENQWERVELDLQGADTNSDAVAAGLRGLALFVREDYAAAAQALNAAWTADPADALAAFFLGWAQARAGDSRSAISAWRAAAHADPSLVSVHLALADAYTALGQPALAVQALRAGLAAIPSSPELRDRLARLEKGSRPLPQ